MKILPVHKNMELPDFQGGNESISVTKMLDFALLSKQYYGGKNCLQVKGALVKALQEPTMSICVENTNNLQTVSLHTFGEKFQLFGYFFHGV
ncbi:hypothetical protein TNCV_947771 [Trichonephila clavipes]|nr:hypothetical protein TNCV_947771 [Trichonephila clavipes]